MRSQEVSLSSRESSADIRLGIDRGGESGDFSDAMLSVLDKEESSKSSPKLSISSSSSPILSSSIEKRVARERVLWLLAGSSNEFAADDFFRCRALSRGFDRVLEDVMLFEKIVTGANNRRNRVWCVVERNSIFQNKENSRKRTEISFGSVLGAITRDILDKFHEQVSCEIQTRLCTGNVFRSRVTVNEIAMCPFCGTGPINAKRQSEWIMEYLEAN